MDIGQQYLECKNAECGARIPLLHSTLLQKVQSVPASAPDAATIAVLCPQCSHVCGYRESNLHFQIVQTSPQDPRPRQSVWLLTFDCGAENCVSL